MDTRTSILARITRFCAENGLSRTEFGRRAVRDRDFIRDLETGKPVTLGRIEQAEAFMAAFADAGADLSVAETAEETGQIAGGADAADVDQFSHEAGSTSAGRRRLREALP